MSTFRCIDLTSVAAAAVMGGLAIAQAGLAGDLTPPAGPVIETMKTLDEVEARIPVNSDTAPGNATYQHVISAPGSYYLTGHVTATPGARGIEISTEGVTLDLNGFAVDGDSGDVTLGNYGVSVSASRVRIHNGEIRNWNLTGITTGAGAIDIENVRFVNCLYAISSGDFSRVLRCYADQSMFLGVNVIVRECQIENGGIFTEDSAMISDCVVTAVGDAFNTGENSTLDRCTAIGGGRGFVVGAGATLRDCKAVAASTQGFVIGPRSILNGCQADQCSVGFLYESFASAVPMPTTVYENCIATACGVGFRTTGDPVDGGIYRNCSAIGNSGEGFDIGGPSTFDGCTAADNLGSGFDLNGSSTLSDCVSLNNNVHGFGGVGAMTLRGCRAEGNGLDGFSAGLNSVVQSCSAANNGEDGIQTSGSSQVRDCTATDNTGFGIAVGSQCMVIDSVAVGNDSGGIYVASRSVVRGCDASFNQSSTTNVPGILAAGSYSRVEGNSCIQNDGPGISVTGDRNVIAKNNLALNNGNVSITGSGNKSSNSSDTATAGAWQNITH